MAKLLTMKCPIVEFKKARQTLLTERLLDRRKKYVIKDFTVFFPLQEDPTPHQLDLIHRRGGKVVKVKKEVFPQKAGKSLSLTELDAKKPFPIPKSITQVGHIILVNELPPGGDQYRKAIGNALKTNFNASGVFLKTEEMKGQKRVAKWSRLAGKRIPIAIHNESGFYYVVDFSKVFFNPRMEGERRRVSSMTQEGEKFIDMFTGVGPFAIPMAKKDGTGYAIDINSAAIKLLKINIQLNRVKDQLVPVLGDAKEVVKTIEEKVDRIIMNYPENSFEFLDTALFALKKKGVIHFYCFSWGESEKQALHAVKKKISGFFSRTHYAATHIRANIVLQVAPAKYLVVLDLTVEAS